jgi:hypothetical protein
MSASDFDFLIGQWSVQHERLTDQFEPDCTTWTRFDTVADVDHILGGLGTADQTRGVLPDGSHFAGFSLRLYTPGTDEWAIWWASASRPGILDEPVRGRFSNGVGTFIGSAEQDGLPYLARFQWLDTTTPNPVWAQDFSFHNGATWAPINWRMTHTKLDPQR